MSFDLQQLKNALELYDREQVEMLCNEFTRELYQDPQSKPISQMEGIMKSLRKKRMFKPMQCVGDASVQTNRSSFTIRRQFAQALIEMGIFTAALALLNELKQETDGAQDAATAFENSEAYGLTGRVYKQLYVNAGVSQPDLLKDYIERSFSAYYKMHEKDPLEYSYHSINTIAVWVRAQKDGIALSKNIDVNKIAMLLVTNVRTKMAKDNAQPWDLATALEASIALSNYDEALEFAEEYISRKDADAFEFASTLRQLTEVWQLDMNDNEGKKLLPLLRGALLMREQGNVIIDAEELRKGVYDETIQLKQPEKVFGADSYKTYEWYMKGSRCCLPIARIGREESKGFGTGFLLEGKHLPGLDGELVLLTNAHVITNDPNERKALRPDEALVLFEVLGLNKTFKVTLHFTSPYKELDVTILKFSKEDAEIIRQALNDKGIELFNISPELPANDGKSRIYIIGHPAGGTLQLSLQDNELLDMEGRLIHYRTPTVGGSSGSPVFNDNWELIGIHHAGGNYMRMLNGKRGMYQANEGIWIQSIINKLKGA